MSEQPKGPPPPVMKKLENQPKKTFQKVEVNEQDFKSQIESRKKEVNTYCKII